MDDPTQRKAREIPRLVKSNPVSSRVKELSQGEASLKRSLQKEVVGDQGKEGSATIIPLDIHHKEQRLAAKKEKGDSNGCPWVRLKMKKRKKDASRD